MRRPAIQKQFYDIEERVIVRPAGSALVELDEPTSKKQKGPAVVQPLHSGEVPLAHHSYAYATAGAQTSFAPSTIPVVAHAPVHLTIAPVLSHAPIQGAPVPVIIPSSTPAPAAAPASPAGSKPATASEPGSEEESVVIENEDFRSAQFRSAQTYNAPLTAIQQQDLLIRQAQLRDNQASTNQIQTAQSQFQQAQIRDALAFRQHQEQQQQQFETLLQTARFAQVCILEFIVP